MLNHIQTAYVTLQHVLNTLKFRAPLHRGLGGGHTLPNIYKLTLNMC